MKITLAHGSGGQLTTELISGIFQKYLSNEILNGMEDAAVLSVPSQKIAFTTDSFVVTPFFFPGGDIGRLCVCGTVNDLLMRGAVPKYLAAGFILEEGLDTEDLERIVRSMRDAAKEAGVCIVAGDTKVIGGKGGIYINASGIGVIQTPLDIGARKTEPGDAVIISGFLGNHEACILSCRMGIENSIESDCAPLHDMVYRLLDGGVEVHAMRDVTRGGLATVLCELALASNVQIELFADAEFADSQVRGFCDILGLDPLYMGNEGKIVLTVAKGDAEKAVGLIRASRYGQNARIIGGVVACESPIVTIKTRSGSARRVEPLMGEGLPRIC
jgi:hydrogenase expression/formation protein HypE